MRGFSGAGTPTPSHGKSALAQQAIFLGDPPCNLMKTFRSVLKKAWANAASLYRCDSNAAFAASSASP